MSDLITFDNVCLTFDVTTYGKLEQVTDTISKCRVRIFYKGLNRNRTYISDDFANQLISSLPYAPIKGIFNYGEVDFEDHGEDNTDGRIYGVVPENHNFAWEKHLDKDGVEREYATADVYLFTGLYPEASLIQDKPQSMEIYRVNLKGEWKIWEDGKPYFHFYKGSLVGLQTLGKEVEPCFEGSAFYNLEGAAMYSLYKDLQDCVNYIKAIHPKTKNEEGEEMDKTLFRLSDNEKAEILFDLINPNFNEEGNWELNGIITDVYDDYALYVNKSGYHRAYYTKDGDNISIGEVVDVKITDVTASEFSALEAMKAIAGTYEAVNESYTKLENEVNELKIEKETYTTEKVALEEAKTALETEKETYTAEKEALEVSISEKDAKIDEYVTQISDLTAENVRLEKEKNDIISENETLGAFKKSVETEKKTAIINEFSVYLTDEQISSFKENMDNYEVADFKKEVCTAAWESDPSIFSKREDSGLIFKGDNSGSKTETGVLGILNKYKNGGNK